MRVALAFVVLLLAGTVGRAEALTIRDVIELTKAGISDEVLLALIDVDGGVYASDPATLKALKEAGVSERVMVALVRSGRERRVPEPPAPAQAVNDEESPPPPPVVVIEHREPDVRQVVVPVPVYVPVHTVPSRSHRRGHGDFDHRSHPVESSYVPFQSGQPAVRPSPQPQAQPVYWGFGGKLRPDAWGQPPAAARKPADEGKPPEKDGKPGRK
jgi:hypothetical protein